jgi:hypothetical protein
MPTFQSIKELTRGLDRGAKLLNDMFAKRKTLSVRYDDALETLDGDESRLQYLIRYGIIVQSGDLLEMDDTYQRFFEEVLSVNEVINIASVQTYISNLRLAIESCLAVANANRKAQFLREVRHNFLSIEKTTRRNIIDLKRNVDYTYKQEPDFKVKRLRLQDFDEKRRQIAELIRQTERVMDEQAIFFANSMDVALQQTVNQVRLGLRESAHALIDISVQITDYLNRIDYQNRIVQKVRQLKYLKDQFMIEESTDIVARLSGMQPVWMDTQPRYMTKVPLELLHDNDAALEILDNVRARLKKKATIRSRLAGAIAPNYIETSTETRLTLNHRELMNGFLAQSGHLFSFVWNYRYAQPMDEEQRLVLFVQLASQYPDELRFTDDTETMNRIEYPIIFPK